MNASENLTKNSTNLPIATYLYCLIPVKLLIGVINYIFNGYIIHLVVFKIKKKTYSNILFLFNAIADLTSGLISIPSMTLFTTIGYWPLGKVTCVIWVINDFAVTSISAFSLLIIAVHRYLQIKRPVETTEKMTKNKWVSIAFQWIIIYAFWAISVIIISSPPEFEVESCYFTSSFPYVLTADLIYYIFPVLGVFVINTLVFIELLKKKNNHPKITGTGNFHIETNKRLEHRDFKALVCLYVVAGLLIFFFAIFFVTWPLKAFGSDLVSDLLLEVGYWICYAYSSVNPIILLIFHEKFNKEFKMSIFKKVFPTSTNSQTRN